MTIVWTVLATVIATVLGTLIIKRLSKRKFLLFVPKLLSFSGLSDDGALVDLTLKNFSSAMEEDIKIAFPQSAKLTLVAASDSEVEIVENIVKVARLSGRQEVSIFVHVDKRDFQPSQIIGVNSKAIEGLVVIGKTSGNTESYTVGDWAQVIIGVGSFVLIGMMIGAFGGFLGLLNVPGNFLLSGDRGGEYWEVNSGLLFSDYISDASERKIPCTYSKPNVKKDGVEVEFFLENKAIKPIEFTIQITSNAEDNKYGFPNTFEGSIFLTAGQERKIILKDDMPTSTDKYLNVECRWDYEDDMFTKVQKYLKLE